ncbi:SRPBCC family protein [Plantibacter sp. Mn2098]|uniref:SRPBCC family protein n=1 Tax=Plantibacter sp. Mn2098 TaxID=3395266 RepID=UPI003BD90F1C
MTVHFVCRTELPVAPELAFELSRSIDAHLGSMADSGERAVGGVTTGLIGDGEQVTWRARHFGIVWTMTSRITAFDAPHTFTDEQVRGPFSAFRHVHTFEPIAARFDKLSDRASAPVPVPEPVEGPPVPEPVEGPPHTLMTDAVTFTAPFGPLGLIAERIALRRHLVRLIESRNEWLRHELTR